MKKIDKHIKLSNELLEQLNYLCITRNIKISEAISNILESYFNKQIKEKEINQLENKITFLTKKINILFELVKQIYSDMDFPNISNPKTSKSLNEFLRKMKEDKLDG